jgi:hypothetical protein
VTDHTALQTPPSDARPPSETAPASGQPGHSTSVHHLQSVPVGWAAILLLFVATVWAVIASLTGFDYASAAFIVVSIMVGAMLGIAAWDLFVSLLARHRGEYLRLPYTITLEVPRWIVPALTPLAFIVGILIGHRFWH